MEKRIPARTRMMNVKITFVFFSFFNEITLAVEFLLQGHI